jgi:hypothetical protein
MTYSQQLKESLVNKIANTEYEPTETTVPGARHTYGQVPGLNSTLRKAFDTHTIKLLEAEIERLEGEIKKAEKFVPFQKIHYVSALKDQISHLQEQIKEIKE